MDTPLPYTIERFTETRGIGEYEREHEMVRVTGHETGRTGTFPASAFDFTVQERDLAYACNSVLTSEEHTRKSALHSAFHTWINQRQDARRKTGEKTESDLYEWLHVTEELARLPGWLRKARTRTLPTVHKQCSRSAPQPIANNRVICALGQDVTACPILASFYESFRAERERVYPDGSPSRAAEHTTEDDADVIAAQICTWHIFQQQTEAHERGSFIDTSEGYVQDEGDRMYWNTVYDHLSTPLLEVGE